MSGSRTLSLLSEAFLAEDPSGYSQAQAHPEPMDPNDRVRQQTQARAGDYPYDTPVSYGRAVGTDMGGAAYQMADVNVGPPQPQHRRASDWEPKSAYGLQSGQEAEAYSFEPMDHDAGRQDTYEVGKQAPDAAAFNYGSHGMLGDGCDPLELDLDALKGEFMQSYLGDTEAERLRHVGLIQLLLNPNDDQEDGDLEYETTYDDDLNEMPVDPEEIPAT